MVDVAKRANVSLATVSRVVNNSSTVHAESRERVLTAMRQLGYEPVWKDWDAALTA